MLKICRLQISITFLKKISSKIEKLKKKLAKKSRIQIMAGSSDDPTGVLTIVNKVVGVYSAFLIIAGTFGNLFLLLMCFLTPLRRTNTFVFLGVMAFTDIVALYWWNLDHFIKPYFGIDRSPSGFLWCRVDTFLQFTALSSSAWLLVS